jgi:hypothetical protein
VSVPVADDVADFLGVESVTLDRIDPHLGAVYAYVKSYTRGRGFEDEPELPDDLAAVIVSVTARSVLNPANYAEETRSIIGDYTRTRRWAGPPIGFTLVEQAVLARYRQRTA